MERLRPKHFGAAAIVAALTWVACSPETPVRVPAGPSADVFNNPPSFVTLCKVGSAATFSVSINRAAPSSVSLNAGDCQVVFTHTDGDRDSVFITETGSPGATLDSVTVKDDPGTASQTITGTSSIATFAGADAGHIVTFYNTVTPPPPPPCPAGSFTFSFNAAGDLLIRYDQFPAPNDNSYGVNAVGWPNGHKFSDLTGSDHAGFQLVDGSNVVRLSFNVDYISADATAPSGYASLGVNGGDGKMLVGTATGITATTSLANNLNNINIPGLFNASHVQQFGSVNVLVNSPPTDAAHQTYNNSDPTLAGWDFHDTYFVTVSAAKLASLGFNAATWQVLPNASQLHNSPAKPCPPPTGGTCALAVTNTVVDHAQLKITIQNNGSTDVFLSDVQINWPSAINGLLKQVKLDGDVVYDNPDIGGGSAHLTTADLVADPNKRKLQHNSSDVLTFIFASNADANLANYSGTFAFGNCIVTIGGGQQQ